MRDFLHAGGLFLLVAFLAMSFPSAFPVPAEGSGGGFARFVSLTPARHDALLEAARTSWQVRSEARSRPSVGRLDADAPLLADSLPPPASPVFRDPVTVAAALPEPDSRTYMFLPATMAAAVPEFAPGKGKGGVRAEAPAFTREELLSTGNSETLKELMR